MRIVPSSEVDVSDDSKATFRCQIFVADPLLHLDAKASLSGGELPLLPPPPARIRAPAVYEEWVDPGGISNVGVEIQREDRTRRIGTMVAGNSGRPGGACGNADGTVDKLHVNHSTQEEDVVANWLITACRRSGQAMNGTTFGGTGETARGHPHASQLYRETLHGRWGMAQMADTNTATLQGVDYTLAAAHEYADAWCVDGAELSHKVVHKGFDCLQAFRTSLVFVAGPNAGTRGRFDISTTRRTFNAPMEAEYALFRAGVQEAVRAGLLAMASLGCNVALLAHVSAGIYAGPHRRALWSDFGALVDEVLQDPRQQPAPLGCYFERVVLAKLAP